MISFIRRNESYRFRSVGRMHHRIILRKKTIVTIVVTTVTAGRRD